MWVIDLGQPDVEGWEGTWEGGGKGGRGRDYMGGRGQGVNLWAYSLTKQTSWKGVQCRGADHGT